MRDNIHRCLTASDKINFFSHYHLILISVLGKIQKLELSIYSDLSCGGEDVFIKLLQDETTCTTQKHGDFDKGAIVSWTGTKLRSCSNNKFDIEILYFQKIIKFYDLITQNNDPTNVFRECFMFNCSKIARIGTVLFGYLLLKLNENERKYRLLVIYRFVNISDIK